MDYLHKYASFEQEKINDTLTYAVIQNRSACIIYDTKNHLFGLTNNELNGNYIDESKEYDYGVVTLDCLEQAIEETFSTKERYELWNSGQMLVIDYIFSGYNGDLLEVVFTLNAHPDKFDIPLERIAALEQKLKKNWKMTFTKSIDYRLKYICDGAIYFFPKVLYVENGPRIKEEGLKEFVPIE